MADERGVFMPLPWPPQGLSDDLAHGAQPPNTTRRARNVRYLEPRTGRSRGGLRSGMSAFVTDALDPGGTDPPVRVDRLAALGYDQPKILFTPLDASDNGTTTPGLISRDTADEGWTFRTGTAVSDVAVDRQDNAYFLTDDGRILKRNPDGELLRELNMPLKKGAKVWPYIALDEADRVYACASNDGGTSTDVYQWQRVYDPENDDLQLYDLRWTVSVPGDMNFGGLVARGGGLWIATRRQADFSYTIRKYTSLSTTMPIEEWAFDAPTALRGIDVDGTGQVFVACDADPGRLSSTGGTTDIFVSWTPHDLGELPDNLATDAESDDERLHFWMSGTQLYTGDESGVSFVNDTRYTRTINLNPGNGIPGGASGNAPEYDNGPLDNTPRVLGTFGARRGPDWRSGSIGPQPAYVFDENADSGGSEPGVMLRSQANVDGGFKLAEDWVGTSITDTMVTDEAVTASWADVTGWAWTGSAADTDYQIRIRLTGRLRNHQVVPGFSTVQLRVRGTYTGTPSGTDVVWITYPPLIVGPGTSDLLDFDTGYVNGPLFNGSATISDVEVQAILLSGPGADIVGTQVAATLDVESRNWEPNAAKTAPTQLSPIPGHQDALTTGAVGRWTWTSIWRLEDTGRMMVMASQKGSQISYLLLGNAAIVGSAVVYQEGSICFLTNQMENGTPVSVPWAQPGEIWQAAAGSIDDPDAAAGSNPARLACVIITHAGGSEADATLNNSSFMRINGRHINYFGLKQMASHQFGGGTGGFLTIGHPHWQPNGASPDDVIGDGVDTVGPFSGACGEMFTLLGSTVSAANDTAADDTTDQDTTLGGTQSEVEHYESYAMYAWGMGHLLPATPTGTDHDAFDTTPAVGNGGTGALDPIGSVIQSQRAILAKVSASANRYVWALNGGGLGLACRSDGLGGVIAVGNYDAEDVIDDEIVIRRIVDLGENYSTDTDDDAWTYSDAAYDPSDSSPRLAIDASGAAYWSQPEVTRARVLKFEGIGNTGATPGTAPVWSLVISTDSSETVRGIALSNDTPLYTRDPADSYNEVPDRGKSPIWLYTADPTADEGNQSRWRIVAETQVRGSENAALTQFTPRKVIYAAISAGNLFLLDPGGDSVTDKGSVLDATNTYVASATLYGKLYFSDGRGIVVYDPVLDTVEPLEASTDGEIPKRARLMAGWNGRLVLARTSETATGWFMSAQGDPTNWDIFPPEPAPTDAVAWNSGRGPGAVPDIITALIPFSDDILLVGCDHSIYKVLGDPLAGGQIDLLSDETGISFGSAWTKDPEGILYFFGQRGGVWAVTRGTDSLLSAARISERRGDGQPDIERRLQGIDLTTFRVEMAWNYREDGLHVIVIPYDDADISGVVSYFWDKKNHGWWEDTFADAQQPTAVAVFDGDDPDDRVVALGTMDGLVLRFDHTAVDDNGTAISSDVVLGPFQPKVSDAEYRFSELQAQLGGDPTLPAEVGCSYEWYVKDQPELDLDTDVATASGTFPAGMSTFQYQRARGRYTWLRLLRSTSGQWNFESAHCRAAEGGRARVRP